MLSDRRPTLLISLSEEGDSLISSPSQKLNIVMEAISELEQVRNMAKYYSMQDLSDLDVSAPGPVCLDAHDDTLV